MSSFSPRPLLLILLLWLAGLGAAGQFAKIAVPLSEFGALYPDAGSGLGWLLSLISVVGIFLGMTAGIIAAKIGYAKLLIWAILLGAVVSAWQAQIPSFTGMLASRLVEGFSHLVIVVVAPTLIAQYSSARFRGMAMAFWSTFFGVSFAIVAWFGLPFISSYGLGNLLLVHSIFMGVLAGLLLLAFRNSGLHIPASDAALSVKNILRQHVNAYRSPNISAPALGWLFYTLTFVSILAILPSILPAEGDAQLIGLLPLISIAASLVLVSFLLTFTSAVSIVIVGFLLAVGILLLALMGLPTSIAFMGLFVVLGLIQGASFAAVTQLNSSTNNRALANGAMAQMGNLGNTVGTPLLFAVLGQFGITGLLLTICSLYAVGAALHLFLLRIRHYN
ncbi:MAG: MFS transporter [Rhodobacteraceae bacterium]|nr:MFS transporter [Paracoccaceae bacterium]